jgi:hypothetical protein
MTNIGEGLPATSINEYAPFISISSETAVESDTNRYGRRAHG